MDGMGRNDALVQTLEPRCVIVHHQTRAMCMRKMTWEVYLSTGEPNPVSPVSRREKELGDRVQAGPFQPSAGAPTETHANVQRTSETCTLERKTLVMLGVMRIERNNPALPAKPWISRMRQHVYV